MKQRYEEMTPAELKAALEARPVVYLPCGLLEWHGDHLPLGTDGLKAHAICLRAAERTGGVVLPVNWVSLQGFDLFAGTLAHRRDTVLPVLLGTLREIEKVGAQVVVILTGHYGQPQVSLVKEAAAEFMRGSRVKVIAQPEYEDVTDEHGERPADHAGKWETSFMMLFRPDLVQMDKFRPGECPIERYDVPEVPGGPDKAFHDQQKQPWVWTEDLRETSSPARGAAILERIVDRLAGLVDDALAKE